jgi:ATP-dependent exoDNAse (exonuclease V) beta subunit
MNAVKDCSWLDTLQPPLDDQQHTVCCTDKNTVVAAGAGSGKTQVLATRFAWLIMDGGFKVDEILTLTFTDKAAAEMYERIYARLSFFAGNEAVPEIPRRRAQQALHNFSDAHIQTLDSYCASIVRQAANRYGIRPDFTIGTADAERAIKNRALPFVLRYRNDAAVQAVAAAGRLQDAADKLFAGTVSSCTSLATPECFFSSYLEHQRNETAAAWNERMQGTVKGDENEDLPMDEIIRRVIDVYAALPDIKKAGAYCGLLKKVLPFDTYAPSEVVDHIPRTFTITPEQIADGSMLKQVDEYVSWLALFRFNQRTAGYTKELVAVINGELNKKTGTSLSALADYILKYRTTMRIYELLDQFLAEVNAGKRKTGSLTFSDVTELALCILRGQDDIRKQEQRAYRRIMIDEFQDNNRKNRDLLFILADAGSGALEDGKLFFVGDEKQSIYKFRGADVAVFNSLKNDLGTGSFQSMVCNYRSTAEVLSACNQLFGGYRNRQKIEGDGQSAAVPSYWVFPEKPLHRYEAEFTERTVAEKFDSVLRVPQEPTVLIAQNVPVHVCMFNTADIRPDGQHDDDYLTEKDQLAYFIARKIQSLVGTETDGRKIAYSDIAVLDRSRTDRGQLIRYLSREGIPYTVDQHRDLFSEAPVNDIYYFLRLCVYPSDMNAFAVFFCSPFAGLSEQSLETVLAVCAEPDNPDFVFKPFDETKAELIKTALPIDQYEKYTAAEALYRDFAGYSLCHRLTDTVTRLWYECGYRIEFEWNSTASLFATQYDLLFEVARRTDADGKSAAWFIDQLAAKKTAAGSFFSADADIDTEDVDFPSETHNAVNIMTIHKSKGLEFPVVFVCGCTGKPKADSSGGSIFYSDEDGVSINFRNGAGNYFFQKQKAEADAKNDAEFRRLFYVAVTRAEQQVYVVGSWRYTDKPLSNPSMMEKIICHYYNDETLRSGPESGTGTIFTGGAPFDFERIVPAAKKEVFTGRSVRKENDPVAKQHVAEEAAPLYERAAVLETSDISQRRFSPSSFEPDFASDDSAAAGTGVLYSEIDHIILFKGNNFSYSRFGTLAHAYLEAAANGIAPEKYIPPDVLVAGLSSAPSVHAMKQVCTEMVRRFEESTVGRLFEVSRPNWYRSEYSFKNVLCGVIITGTIDLLFRKADGTYVIVDYKTDREMQPERYYFQLYCYRKAAAALCSVDVGLISCMLYYLRYDSSCDITGDVAKITDTDLEPYIKK